MHRRRSTRILPVLAVVAAVTLAVVLAVSVLGRRVAQAHQQLIEAQRTQILLAEVLASVSDAEAGQRGYLLTGNQQDLGTYQQALARVEKELSLLEAAAASGHVAPSAIRDVREHVRYRADRLQRAVETYHSSGREAAMAEIALGEGRRAMEDLRATHLEVTQQQVARIAKLRQVSLRANAYRNLSAFAGAAVVLAFLIWAYRRLSVDILELERTERELAEGRQRLEGIVASAMDAIISIDEQQNIVLFNAAAEKVFGYSSEEIMGKPLDVLIPERFRRDHRGHVHRFGETGQTTRAMGAAHMNLTALRADGTEFPIDASISQVEVGGQKLYTAILRDITERRRAEKELLDLHADLERRVRDRTAELAEANRELEAFGYSVSHDLRAPLRHVTGFVELLEKHAADSLDEKGKRYLETIHVASRRMGNLIDDLLTLSRIGRATLARTEVDLRELVDESVAQLAHMTNGRRIEWKIGELPVVLGDPTLLRNVVMNLLSNALKYSRTRDPAVIEVGSRKEDNDVICFFRDNGVGFDMRYVDKLFGVFQRLHRAEEFEGTGIGLASVRRIIQRHGGRTWAEGAVDQGATVYFSLPAEVDRT